MTAGSVTVTQGSPGVLTSGGVSGTHTYAAAGDYVVQVTVADDDSGSAQVSVVVHVSAASGGRRTESPTSTCRR